MSSSWFSFWPLVALITLTWIGGYECEINYRLKTDVLPSLYNLKIQLRDNTITPDSPATNYDGEVSITLQTPLENVKEITLHKDVSLVILKCVLLNAAGQQVELVNNAKLTSVEQSQQLTVGLTQALAPNVSYALNFNFVGKVQTDTVGLFSASYMDAAAMKTKWVLLTHMQPINARLVFPCFDEPTFKAKFQLQITRPASLNAVSNTKLIQTVNEEYVSKD